LASFDLLPFDGWLWGAGRVPGVPSNGVAGGLRAGPASTDANNTRPQPPINKKNQKLDDSALSSSPVTKPVKKQVVQYLS